MEESKQESLLQKTPPPTNPKLSLALNHVLKNILCMDPNTSLIAKMLVAEQITTIEEFAFLEEEDIDSLDLNGELIKQYPDTS